jgi:hypothetical protein
VRTRTRARTPFCPARPQVFKQYLGQVGFISYFSCLFVATGAMLYLRCLPPLPPRDRPACPGPRLPWDTPALGNAVLSGCRAAHARPPALARSLYTHFGTDFLLIDILICSFTGSMTVMATKGLAMFLRTVRSCRPRRITRGYS